MHSPLAPGRRGRSAFTAAFLSLLFPGLGHAYAGAWHRALGFAAAPILLGSLVLGIVLRADRLELLGTLLQPTVLTGILVLDVVALVYRAVATIDAYRVVAYLNALEATGGGRLGRPRVPYHPASVAGLVAVLLVMSGAHVALARYDLLALDFVRCELSGTGEDCELGGPGASPGASAGPTEPGATEPAATDEPAPPLSLPPVGTAVPSTGSAPPWSGTERLNILLIGADEQGGGHNTDTLIVVSIDPVSRRVAMFGLPRDTVDVPIPPGPARSVFGPVYRGKINSLFVAARQRPDAFPGSDRTRGYVALKSVLGELYGLDIRYFVEVNFQGFKQVVDALGGVTVNVQFPVVDDYYPGETGRSIRVYIPSGPRTMDGAEALVYARSRHGKFGRGSSDFDRGARQQRLLISLRQQADIGRAIANLDALVGALKNAIRTDIPVDDLPRLLRLADEIDVAAIRSYVFTPPRFQREILSGDPRGYVIVPYVDRIQAAVRAAFTVDPEAEARREALAAEGATVWVLNGSGEAGQAARIAAYLESEGIAATAPNQRPDRRGLPATRIEVYNGAEARVPQTIACLEATFGVTAMPVADPAVRADIVIITARTTPDLTPPPAP